jgi:hypothetical protein
MRHHTSLPSFDCLRPRPPNPNKVSLCFSDRTGRSPVIAITDEASPFALLSTHLIRGEQCAEARLDGAETPRRCPVAAVVGTVALAVSPSPS